METWKDIPSLSGYQASTDGRIRSVDRFVPNGVWGKKFVRGRIRKLHPDGRGYLTVSFWKGRVFTRAVHDIVSETFLGPKPDGWQVNHIDGNKQKNAVTNLEYCTAAENSQHAVRNGLRGQSGRVKKLSVQQVKQILALKVDGVTNLELSKMFEKHTTTISRIVNRKRWSSVVALVLLMFAATGCPSRQEVEGEIWLNSGLPPELCKEKPSLSQFGIYRKLNSGKVEFLSYCTKIQDENGKPMTAVQAYISINGKKFNNYLDELLPKSGNQAAFMGPMGN